MNETTDRSQTVFSVPWLVSPLLLGITLGFYLCVPGYSDALAAIPFLLSLFVLGMPHGSSDLACLRERFGSSGQLQVYAWFSVYLLGMVVVTAFLLFQPALSLLIFAVFSAWHFGRSDLHQEGMDGAGESRGLSCHGWVFNSLRVAARGVLLIALPTACHPDAVLALANEWMALLPGAASLTSPWSTVSTVANALSWGAIFAQVVILGVFALNANWAALIREAVEVTAVCCVLTFLNPVFGLGSYFLFWHGLRHLNFQSHGKWHSAAVWREACGLDRRAVILFLPTVAAYLGLSFFLFEDWNPLGQVALLLIFFAVVTPSHEVLHISLAGSAGDKQGEAGV